MYFYEEYNYGNQQSYDAFSLTNASYPYHFHRCYEILSVISGHMQLKVSDQEYTLSPGDIGFIFPDQSQFYSYHRKNTKRLSLERKKNNLHITAKIVFLIILFNSLFIIIS